MSGNLVCSAIGVGCVHIKVTLIILLLEAAFVSAEVSGVVTLAIYVYNTHIMWLRKKAN